MFALERKNHRVRFQFYCNNASFFLFCFVFERGSLLELNCHYKACCYLHRFIVVLFISLCFESENVQHYNSISTTAFCTIAFQLMCVLCCVVFSVVSDIYKILILLVCWNCFVLFFIEFNWREYFFVAFKMV